MPKTADKPKRGRPPKPEGEKFEIVMLRMPPADAARLKEKVAPDERAEFMRTAIRKALALSR
jgi:hypothetical protein